MKTNLTYPTVFAVVAGLYLTLLSLQPSPEFSILGEWREVSWEYEKGDSLLDGSFDYRVTDHIKAQLLSNLIIHEAEIWNFANTETLEMSGRSATQSLVWKLKGRGNILQIQRGDHATEYYQIQELSEDRMVLHFNFDMQVRGIVKMTFERINT
ncbi:hypothetical protein GCM10009119_24370 [Algoriphagus jejuensis]|uniref:Lipocalin-like protein n=1 Tax=Algoriphagus jejuensis TaxID=419934 RepID=A0ABN1N1J6_9BACT